MTRRYGRALSGQRLQYICPYQRGSHHSIISAISISQITAAMYTSGSINGDIFLHFLSNYLAPKLTKQHIVILDNVSFHKVTGVREIITGTGAELLYLPPYSPDLSPIEHMWSKIKAYLRRLNARCTESFKKAIEVAFKAVQPSDLYGWYNNCGYKGSIIF